MATFLAAFAVFGLAVLGMALGALLQGRRLRGSCGRTGGACVCSPLAARHCTLSRPNAGPPPNAGPAPDPERIGGRSSDAGARG